MLFLLIDDDPVSNLISKLTLESALGPVRTKNFTDAQEGLSFLQDPALNKEVSQLIVLLDLNMPLMNGWEFLDRFDAFPSETKKRTRIFILSSSIDVRDKQRSYANKNVIEFITKPLTVPLINQLLLER